MNFWGAGLLAVVLAIQEKPIITGDCSDENLNRLAITHGRYLKSIATCGNATERIRSNDL